MQPRTKIVASIGPATQSVTTLTQLMRAGIHAARLNFSHGTHASHKRLYRNIRAAEKKAKKNVAVLGDLQGPKIRIGDIGDPIEVRHGDVIEIPVTLSGLGKSLNVGQKVFIDDGKYQAKYRSGKEGSITIEMISDCTLISHKGLSVPGLKLKGIQSFTKKDKEDAKFALSLGVDWLVVSFVERKEDIEVVRRFVHRQTKTHRPAIMAKIERAGAVKRINEILKVADGIMIGRGDLALDVPIEEVPIIQKELITKARKAGKPVIVATQMLESMTHSPVPTRAEVSDVANAVIDHTDAVMLSGETAMGEYPVETVRVMRRTLEQTEASAYDDVTLPKSARGIAAKQLLQLAKDVQAGTIKAIVCDKRSMEYAWGAQKHRLEVPVILVGEDDMQLRQSLLRWSVQPVKVRSGTDLKRTHKLLTLLNKMGHVNKRTWVAVLRKEKRSLVIDHAKI